MKTRHANIPGAPGAPPEATYAWATDSYTGANAASQWPAVEQSGAWVNEANGYAVRHANGGVASSPLEMTCGWATVKYVSGLTWGLARGLNKWLTTKL